MKQKKTERITPSVKKDFEKVVEWLVHFQGSSYAPVNKGDKVRLEQSTRALTTVLKQY